MKQIPQITDLEKKAALRFCETCEDSQGYDVPKPMMKRLTELGLVVHKGAGVYQGTSLLDRLQETGEYNPDHLPERKPTKTVAQRQADLRQRRADQGLTEIRGIYAKFEDHAKIKVFAKVIVKRY